MVIESGKCREMIAERQKRWVMKKFKWMSWFKKDRACIITTKVHFLPEVVDWLKEKGYICYIIPRCGLVPPAWYIGLGRPTEGKR